MQSFQDLNNYGNTPVDYGTTADYTIAFGNIQGNVTDTIYDDGYYPIYQRATLDTFSDAPNDLIITLVTSNADPIGNVVYFGTGNIQVFSSLANTWSVTGIRTIADYNDAFANVQVETVGNVPNNYTLTHTVSDQQGNTESWTANLTIIANPGVTLPTTLTYDEDALANISGITITDPSTTGSEVYAITMSVTGNTVGEIEYANANTRATSITQTSTKTNLNSALSGNQWRFVPAADRVANSVVTYTQRRVSDDRIWTGNITFTVGTTHSESTVPASITYDEDTWANITGIQITDTRPDNIDSTILYDISLATANTAFGQIRYANALWANLTLTNTKSNLNSILSSNAIQWQPGADVTANGNITYTQYQATDGILQTNSNIAVLIGNTHTDYSVMANVVANEDTVVTIGNISITDIRPDNIDAAIQYEVSIQNPNVSNGNLRLDTVVNNDIIFTGTKASVNSQLGNANIVFVPAADYVGNTVILYNQSQTTDNIVQAANVAIGIEFQDQADYSVPAQFTFLEDTDALITGIQILDERPLIDPTIQYTVSLAVQDTSKGNIVYNNTVYGNFVVTNTKSVINNIFSGNTGGVFFRPAIDFADTTNVLYSQRQITDGIQQASNVNILAMGTASDEYSVPALVYFVQDTANAVANLAILDAAGTSNTALQYTVEIASSDPANIQIARTNPSFIGNSVSITGTKSNVNAALGNITIVPQNEYIGNTTILYSQTRLIDTSIQAANVAIAVQGPAANIAVPRTYTSREVDTAFFANNTPVIHAQNQPEATYTIIVSSDVGAIGNSASNAANNSTYQQTANVDVINADLANLVFVPFPGSFVDGSYSILVTRSGNVIVDINSAITIAGNATPYTPRTLTYAVGNTGPANISFEEIYYGNVRLLLVGGGAASQGTSALGGAGGGEVIDLSSTSWNQLANMQPGTWNISVGAGANKAEAFANTGIYSGESSTITLDGNVIFEARGGLPSTNTTGGNSGGNLYVGGIGNLRTSGGFTANVTGGGAGSAANGDNWSANVSTGGFQSGWGGNGTVSDITGTAVAYGGGGGGGADRENSYPFIIQAGLGRDGGGNGQLFFNAAFSGGSDGVANTGGGGGGTFQNSVGSGGSGIIIIKVT